MPEWLIYAMPLLVPATVFTAANTASRFIYMMSDRRGSFPPVSVDVSDLSREGW